MLIDDRIREAFWLFGIILPLGKDSPQKQMLQAFVNEKLEKVIPEVMHILAEIFKSNKDETESYLIFVEQAIQYIRGERDQLPEVDYPVEEIQKLIKIQLYKNKEN